MGSLLLQPHPPSPAKIIEELEQNPLNFLSPQELLSEDQLNKEYFSTKRNENDNAKISAEFMGGFRHHFLKELYQYTIDFDTKYINSLNFLNAERHNIHSLLRDVADPSKLPTRSLLFTIDSVTHALHVGYLNCRFTTTELRSVLKPALDYLDTNLKLFLPRAGIYEKNSRPQRPTFDIEGVLPAYILN